jgi:hypothetical protein
VQPPIETDAKFKHPLFDTMGVQHITMLPVYDARANKTLNVDINDIVHSVIVDQLARRGYEATIVEDESLVSKISYEDVALSRPGWVQELGPNGVDWVMLIMVQEFYRTISLTGSFASATLSGHLYNKPLGEKVWEAVGNGKFAFMLISAAWDDDTALELASYDLAASFPVNRNAVSQ